MKNKYILLSILSVLLLSGEARAQDSAVLPSVEVNLGALRALRAESVATAEKVESGMWNQEPGTKNQQEEMVWQKGLEGIKDDKSEPEIPASHKPEKTKKKLEKAKSKQEVPAELPQIAAKEEEKIITPAPVKPVMPELPVSKVETPAPKAEEPAELPKAIVKESEKPLPKIAEAEKPVAKMEEAPKPEVPESKPEEKPVAEVAAPEKKEAEKPTEALPELPSIPPLAAAPSEAVGEAVFAPKPAEVAEALPQVPAMPTAETPAVVETPAAPKEEKGFFAKVKGFIWSDDEEPQKTEESAEAPPMPPAAPAVAEGETLTPPPVVAPVAEPALKPQIAALPEEGEKSAPKQEQKLPALPEIEPKAEEAAKLKLPELEAPALPVAPVLPPQPNAEEKKSEKKAELPMIPALEPVIPAPAAEKPALPDLPAIGDKKGAVVAAVSQDEKAAEEKPVEEKPAEEKKEEVKELASLPIPPLPGAEPGAVKEATGDAPSFRIEFVATETELPIAVEPQLKSIAEQAKTGDKRITVVAFAGGTAEQASAARRISLTRALAIRSFLIENGIDNARINVQAMGNRFGDGPPDRVDIFLK